MKQIKIIVSSFVGLMAFSSLALANDQIGKVGNYKDVEPWGMGGCGFASLFIKEKETLPQIGASLVNELFSNSTQSIAISSGTSNCVASRKDLASKEQEVFITVNLSSLSKEAAQGSGEHISALAEVFGCPNSDFIKLSQAHYNKIYETNEAAVVLQNYLNEVKQDQNLAKSCLRII